MLSVEALAAGDVGAVELLAAGDVDADEAAVVVDDADDGAGEEGSAPPPASAAPPGEGVHDEGAEQGGRDAVMTESLASCDPATRKWRGHASGPPDA
ncbi:hypothetical protein [Micrococcus luteus]|uniref:hypothetical protein n=1 Tax=Micrococcus luteus TaxID=1270 RepID=UPI0021B39760|nr:hypothetical protein [Micrococcus luteus]